jgi:hypothetical protein
MKIPTTNATVDTPTVNHAKILNSISAPVWRERADQKSRRERILQSLSAAPEDNPHPEARMSGV